MAATATNPASGYFPNLIGDGVVEHDLRAALVGTGSLQTTRDVSPESPTVTQSPVLTGRVPHAKCTLLHYLEPAGRQVRRPVGGGQHVPPHHDPPFGEDQARLLPEEVSVGVESPLRGYLCVQGSRCRA